jgi:hypothetical protein
MIKIGTTVAYHLPGRRLAHRARDERPHAGRDRRGDEEDQEGCDQIWHVGPDRSDEVVECLNPEHVHCDRDRADENQPERDLADESRRLPRDAAHPVARRSLLQPLVQPRRTQNARDQAGDDLRDEDSCALASFSSPFGGFVREGWGCGRSSGVESSPGWTRTNNPPVNSRMLCQLSYRGTAREF